MNEIAKIIFKTCYCVPQISEKRLNTVIKLFAKKEFAECLEAERRISNYLWDKKMFDVISKEDLKKLIKQCGVKNKK